MSLQWPLGLLAHPLVFFCLRYVSLTAHVRESKVVHALLSAYWAYWSGWGQGVIGGYEEAKKSLKEPGASCLPEFHPKQI